MAIKTFVNGDFVSYTDINTYGANNHMKFLYESTTSATTIWTGSVFTSEFENYYISITNASTVTAQKTLIGRFTYGGSSANQISGAVYNMGYHQIGSDTTQGIAGAVNQTGFWSGEVGIDSTKPSAFQLMVYRPALAAIKGVNSRGWGPVGAVERFYTYATAVNTTTACDGIIFYNNSFYNMNLTIRVYGLRQT